MSSKYRNNRICADSVKCICVAGNHTFKRVMHHDALFEVLLIFCLSCHGRLWDNDRRFGSFHKRIKKMLHKGEFVLAWVGFCSLRIRRIHHADCRTLLLHQRRILL